jgi:hypothetical protein
MHKLLADSIVRIDKTKAIQVHDYYVTLVLHCLFVCLFA